MDPKIVFLVALLAQSYKGKKFTYGASSGQFDPSRVSQISWNPRAFIYRGFLSDDECDHLIYLGKDKLEESQVVDEENGINVMSEYRTSSSMFLPTTIQDNIVSKIEAKIAAWTFLPQENGEDIQILRYKKGQKYGVHPDYAPDDVAEQERGGNRLATILMYLSNVDLGGETVFPYSQTKYGDTKGDYSSDCAKQGQAVKPRKGDALLFFSLFPNGTIDPSSMHEACPVIKGEKWSATKWIRVRAFKTMTSRLTTTMFMKNRIALQEES
ncbi:probable prolyl 4-hydroxylase 7 [Andrographis paniculata]|uniref:probable prolyl 4-hydroxylase 7 n=1 Tax=Andrographis paniculata TaxID=175694 RepID=UPI0021E9327B|nr:probable prolyl 4-hydroxylase 7 [Andrographis paniculata]